MRSKAKYKIFLILAVLIIAGILLFHYRPNLWMENSLLNWSIRIVLIMAIVGFVIYAVKKGNSTKTLKKVLRETAEKTGLEPGKPTGIGKLVELSELRGKYKGHNFVIRVFNSATDPLGGRLTNLIIWGYFDLHIEVGPFQINHNHPRIKRENHKQEILLPEELKQMPYDFHNDAIVVLSDKLGLRVEYKCPEKSEDLIKILNILAGIANDIKVYE